MAKKKSDGINKKFAEFATTPAAPAIVLAIDPGKKSGATLARGGLAGELIVDTVHAVDTDTRWVESTIVTAMQQAKDLDLPLSLVIERPAVPKSAKQHNVFGGVSGSVAIWTRQWRLHHAEMGDGGRSGRTKIWAVTRVHKVLAVTWRSVAMPRTGRVDNGKWRRFTSEEWKAEAVATVERLAPGTSSFCDLGPDEAESLVMAAYALKGGVSL